MKPNILVTYAPDETQRKTISAQLADFAPIRYLTDADAVQRRRWLQEARVVLSLGFSSAEMKPEEVPFLEKVRLVQLVYAGADRVPFAQIPAGAVVACNAGAFAGPLAEHVLAMTLALAKSLLPKHRLLAAGRFDRSGFNRELSGKICGIIGMGGNGRAVARLMQAIGMRVYAVNRQGKTDAAVDFIGTPADMYRVLAQSAVVVLTVPLTRQTRGLIGKKELESMQPDAILINVARGAVVDQGALYEHMQRHPDFCAGIDTWWSEPAPPARFQTDYPFFELPNLLGSPHNADIVPSMMEKATLLAVQNMKNFLQGRPVRGVLDRRDYL